MSRLIGYRLLVAMLLTTMSIVPATAVVSLNTLDQHSRAAADVDGHLSELARDASDRIRDDFSRFRYVLLVAARDMAFAQSLRPSSHQEDLKTLVDSRLVTLSETFPGMIDEVCLIRLDGSEVSRVSKGIAVESDHLSIDETTSPFFPATVRQSAGGIHHQTPYVSTDTARWVISFSTPVIEHGEMLGLLHFEVPLAFYHDRLAALMPADATLTVIGPNDDVYVNTAIYPPTVSDLPKAPAMLTDTVHQPPDGRIHIYPSGFVDIVTEGQARRLRWERVDPAPGAALTVLASVPATPPLIASFISVLPILGAVFATALSLSLGTLYLLNIGGIPAPTARLRSPVRVGRARAFLLVPLLIVAGAVGTALAVNASQRIAREYRGAITVLARIQGVDRELDALKHHTLAESGPDTNEADEPRTGSLRAEQLRLVDELRALDPLGDIPARLAETIARTVDLESETRRLASAGRTGEARALRDTPVDQAQRALVASITRSSDVYEAAAERAELISTVSAAVGLVGASFVMSALVWHGARSRRSLDLLEVERQTLRRSEERFASLIRNSQDVILICDRDGIISYTSPAASMRWAVDPGSLDGDCLRRLTHPEDRPRLGSVLESVAKTPGAGRSIELRIRHPQDEWRVFEVEVSGHLDDPSIAGIVLTFHDVTERIEFEQQLSHQAFHDALTGLPNRAMFFNHLENALARSARTHHTVTVLFADLDNFKIINDSLGHQVGDGLLCIVATRLSECVRTGDIVARLGGDEFAILLQDLQDPSEAEDAATRVLTALSKPATLGNVEVSPSISIGVVPHVPGDATADELMRDADLALYRAKGNGRGRFELFDTSMSAAAMERLELEADLRRATERDELRLVYQPIVALDSGHILEVEALIRWQHHLRGMISPTQFVPIAEESGLIIPIGHWVLRRACSDAVTAMRTGKTDPLTLCVNLSARQFQHPSLVDDIAHILKETGLEPRYLKLELTETVLMRNVDVAVAIMKRLKALGVRLAIDDFGTGYSSLNYLKRFPVDTIKIDRSFVADLAHNAQDAAIIQGVVHLARSLQLSVTGEGIETPDQLQRLRALGCERGQGYLFAKPLSLAELGELRQSGPILQPRHQAGSRRQESAA
ncbi:MAG: EAL domain-containing protein [Chloroflexota bacterium]